MLISFVSFGDTQLESQILAQKCCTKKARRPLHIKWCNSFKNQYFFDIFFLSGSLWSWEQVNNRWNYCIFDRNEMAENLRKLFFASDFSYKFRIKIFHIYWCNSLKNQVFFDFLFLSGSLWSCESIDNLKIYVSLIGRKWQTIYWIFSLRNITSIFPQLKLSRLKLLNSSLLIHEYWFKCFLAQDEQIWPYFSPKIVLTSWNLIPVTSWEQT